MKKKILIVGCIALVVSIAVYCLCTKGIFTNHIYFPRNVYEEIWNMLAAEERGKTTPLTTAADDAEEVWYEDPYTGGWDGQSFSSIQYRNTKRRINWRESYKYEKVLLEFHCNANWPDERETEFGYDFETKTLYGTKEEAWVVENFLTDYFRWCEEDSDFESAFSMEDLGDFHYQKVESLFHVLHPNWPDE